MEPREKESLPSIQELYVLRENQNYLFIIGSGLKSKTGTGGVEMMGLVLQLQDLDNMAVVKLTVIFSGRYFSHM